MGIAHKRKPARTVGLRAKSCSSGAGRGVYTNVRRPPPSRSPLGCAARREVICENEECPKPEGQGFPPVSRKSALFPCATIRCDLDLCTLNGRCSDGRT